MSIDIDMETYAGASSEPAAAVQQVETNSYQQDASEYPVAEALEQPAEQAGEPEASKQELNFRALSQEVDRMKAEREAEKREYQLQLDMLRANLAQQNAPRSESQDNKFLGGMKEEDIPNVGELRREWERKEAVYQQRLEELQVAQQYPDYAEVLDKHLAPLVKQKPHLARTIQRSENPALTAYEIGRMAQQMQGQQVASTRSENAQRIVDNSKKPGTLSQAGGQGALSKADYYASMSDQEFMRMASRNLEGI